MSANKTIYYTKHIDSTLYMKKYMKKKSFQEANARLHGPGHIFKFNFGTVTPWASVGKSAVRSFFRRTVGRDLPWGEEEVQEVQDVVSISEPCHVKVLRNCRKKRALVNSVGEHIRVSQDN